MTDKLNGDTHVPTTDGEFIRISGKVGIVFQENESLLLACITTVFFR